jgi:NAD-dependent deacetylase
VIQVDKSLIDEFRKASSIVFFTGAGVSAESGISTFRGEDGLWKKFKPEELASFDAFIKNP